MKKHLLLLALVGVLSIREGISGDNDSATLRNIPEVTISRTRNLTFKDDKSILVFDSLALLRAQPANLAELLQFNTPVIINQYGSTGSLTTLSFRGTGANHSLVSWNGFPLNSISSGELDLSLAPSELADQILVVSTATGAICGSGTFGGAVELNNYADWKNRLQVKFTSEFGSFDQKRTTQVLDINPGSLDNRKISLKIKTGNNRIQSSTYIFNKDALNKYPFKNRVSIINPIDFQEHNEYSEVGIIQSLNYKINHNNQVEGAIWWQDKNYELPIFSKSDSSEYRSQSDSAFKTYLKWQWFKNNKGITVKTAYFNDFMHYMGKNIDSRIGSKIWLNDINFRNNYSSKILYGLGFSYYRRMSDNNNYSKDYIENWYIFYSDVRIDLKPYILNISLRKDFVQGTAPLPQLSVGSNYHVNKNIVTRINISNKFRLPNFNEKYWPEGGNPNLKPETGWSLEGGGDFTFFIGKVINKFGITAYTTTVNNWIQWVQPLEAKNFKRVWSRGIEGSIEQLLSFNKNNLRFILRYNYTPVTSTKSDNENSSIINKQLMLVPVNNINANISFHSKFIDLGYRFLFHGTRYTSNDETGIPLESYYLSDIYLEKTVNYKSNALRIAFKINNLLNEQYELIPAYPMPGRAFYITINYLLNKTE